LQTGVAAAVGSMFIPFAKVLSSRTIARADAVTVEAKAHTPVARKDATVIPMGIDLSVFSPSIGDSVPGRIVAVCALLPRKGLDVLIRALAIAREHNRSIHLVIAGAGPERQNLVELADKLSVGQAVSLVGRVPRASLVSLYRSGVGFCQPARVDNFPTAVIEAMACGLVPLVSDFGALPEMVADAGLVHPSGNADLLAAQLLALVGDANHRRQLAATARDRATGLYSEDRMCDLYLSLYHGIQKSRPAGDLEAAIG
jgi:glycosyltransferase involved in cell wall biosynthesis